MELAVLAWLAFGLADAGFSYAHAQRGYGSPDIRRRLFLASLCILFVLGGPISLVSSFLNGAMNGDPLKWFRSGWMFPGVRP